MVISCNGTHEMDKGIPQTSLCTPLRRMSSVSCRGLIQLLLPLVFSRNEVFSTVTQYLLCMGCGPSVTLSVTISLKLCVTGLVPTVAMHTRGSVHSQPPVQLVCSQRFSVLCGNSRHALVL